MLVLFTLYFENLTRRTFIHRSLFSLQSAAHNSIFTFPVIACLDPQILLGKNGCNRDHHQYKGEASIAKQFGEAIARNEGKFRNGKSCGHG